MSAAGRALSRALDKPEDWVMVDKYTINHIPSGQKFWVVSGVWFFDGWHPDTIRESIGLIERHWLFFKSRRIRARFRHDPVMEVVKRFSGAQ